MIGFSLLLFLVAAAVFAGDDSKSSHLLHLLLLLPFRRLRGEAGHRHVSRHQGARQLPLAGGREESGDAEVGGGGDGLHPRCARSAAGARGDSQRLTELLSIGSVTPPVIAGGIISIPSARGCRTSRSSMCARALDGKDRVLVDANQLAADGTIALDWFQPSENGKYVAYGTSPSGSEMSTLHIIETKTGTVLPDTIERTRAASIAWKLDNSGFYYTRYPKKGDVARRPGDVQPARLLSPARGRSRRRRQTDFRRRARCGGLAERSSLERRALAAHHRLAGMDQVRTLF